MEQQIAKNLASILCVKILSHLQKIITFSKYILSSLIVIGTTKPYQFQIYTIKKHQNSI